ncbi:unnamed protein product [Arabidopsis arenosa]|uniref:DUF4283 domain-containing protein n=1 Tax=Arabidopsis arenosa TaxID=38785 RepID=A0A8S1ZW12_ARAAE|nr:unnamed protein product [Arabidopsis arenosa]
MPPAASPSRREGLVMPENGEASPVIAESHVSEFPVLKRAEEGVVSKQGLRESGSEKLQEVSSSNQNSKRSFLQVVQKRSFTQQKVVVSEVDGCKRVVVPKEVFVGAKPIWEDFLIGKFLNEKAPHVGKIHMIVNKIWRLGDRTSLIDVYAVNDSTVKFRIRNEGMRHRILNRGMWNIMDIPMIVSKWTPFAEETQPAMKSIPLWVTLENVPPTLFTDKGLEFLASAVGKPIRLHPKTEACTSFDEAQFLVKADLTKELPSEYIFTGEEEGELESTIKYSYPWLPPRCSCCKKWGHLRATCLSVQVVEEKDTQSSDSPPKIAEETGTKSTQSPNVAVPVSENQTHAETSENVEKVTIEDEVEGWITPKSGRSSPGKGQKTLQYGEVSILSNAYSVLEEKEDETEEKQTGDPQGESTANAPDQVETQLPVTTQEAVAKGRNQKETTLRPSLPRHSKTAHKALSHLQAPSTRDPSRDLSKKNPPKLN